MGGKRERLVSEPLQHVGLCSARFPPPSLLLHTDTEQADRGSVPLLCARSLPALCSCRLLWSWRRRW